MNKLTYAERREIITTVSRWFHACMARGRRFHRSRRDARSMR